MSGQQPSPSESINPQPPLVGDAVHPFSVSLEITVFAGAAPFVGPAEQVFTGVGQVCRLSSDITGSVLTVQVCSPNGRVLAKERSRPIHTTAGGPLYVAFGVTGEGKITIYLGDVTGLKTATSADNPDEVLTLTPAKRGTVPMPPNEPASPTPTISPKVTAIQPINVFRTAVIFEHAFQCVGDTLAKAMALNTESLPMSAYWLAPLGANAGFSAELYLKCLIQLDTGSLTPPHGHILLDLFRKLLPATQDRVRHHYDEIGKWAVANNKAMPAGVEKSFDLVLQTMSDVFVKFRYFFEEGHMAGTYSYTDLVYAIRRTVTERYPDWARMEAGLKVPPTSLTR